MSTAREIIVAHIEKQNSIACSEVWQKNNVKKNNGNLTKFDQLKYEILSNLKDRALTMISTKSDENLSFNKEKLINLFNSYEMIKKAHSEAYKLTNQG